MSESSTNLNDGQGLEIAHPEDFGITRDDEGELTPTAQRLPGTDMAIRCKPLVGGAAERWEDVLESDSADDDRVDSFLREYVVEGVGSEGIDDVPDYLVPSVIKAVQNSSGYESFRELQRRKEEENLRTFEKMDNIPESLMMKFLGMEEDEMEEVEQRIENGNNA